MKASIASIETFGLVDGPGIRTVIFFNGCKLRCKYCHNPEMWNKQKDNYTIDDIYRKILRNKNYFKNNGGVTFSGGEALLHKDFIIELSKKLKEANIHIALDTSGVGNHDYEDLLQYIDLILLDIKHTNKDNYKELTGQNIEEVEYFIKICNKLNKKIWIRQVIIPNITDTEEYLSSLKDYLKKINNIERIDFLPYHKLALDKYKKLKIKYPFKDIEEMDKTKCNNLYNKFIKELNKDK